MPAPSYLGLAPTSRRTSAGGDKTPTCQRRETYPALGRTGRNERPTLHRFQVRTRNHRRTGARSRPRSLTGGITPEGSTVFGSAGFPEAQTQARRSLLSGPTRTSTAMRRSQPWRGPRLGQVRTSYLPPGPRPRPPTANRRTQTSQPQLNPYGEHHRGIPRTPIPFRTCGRAASSPCRPQSRRDRRQLQVPWRVLTGVSMRIAGVTGRPLHTPTEGSCQ